MLGHDVPPGSQRFAPTSASSLNRKYEGTGLGLPLAKALVELHGGSLVLDSRVGEGTRATAYFPAARIVSGGDARPRGLSRPARFRRPSAGPPGS